MKEGIIVTEREPDPGQQWKCGDEFLLFHPQASHVPPEYRGGWNRCYWMAVARREQERVAVDASRGGEQGCDYCRHPLFAALKCPGCGRANSTPFYAQQGEGK